MLFDLGMMEGVRNRDHYVAAQLQMADKSQSGTLSVEEFSAYYSSLVLAGAFSCAAVIVLWKTQFIAAGSWKLFFVNQVLI